VSETATFKEIRHAYQRLSKRCEPANFVENTDEAAVAARLLARVQWAYTYLGKDVSETEKRFGSLEVD
jgi:curved DNA-binding protein CbpA